MLFQSTIIVVINIWINKLVARSSVHGHSSYRFASDFIPLLSTCFLERRIRSAQFHNFVNITIHLSLCSGVQQSSMLRLRYHLRFRYILDVRRKTLKIELRRGKEVQCV